MPNQTFRTQSGPMVTQPNFTNPPVDEVVLGVQFETPSAYTSVHAGRVWDLFRREFPRVTEVARLEPQFEVFGGNPTPSFQFSFGGGPLRSRLWFISKDETHLLQLQEDRFFLNWRKRPNGISSGFPYPRYEQIASTYRETIDQLNRYFHENFGSGLKITQAEASYFNIVPLESFSSVGKIFSFLTADALNLEGFATNLVETVLDANRRPKARAYYELQSLLGADLQKLARLALTVRGKPQGEDVSAGLAFIDAAHLHIITKFCDLTTTESHQKWGRIT